MQSQESTPPVPWLRRLDLALAAVIIGFVLLVIVHTAITVPNPWLYLYLFRIHDQLARLGLALALVMLLIAVYIGILRKGDVTPLFKRGTYIIFGTMVVQALLGTVMYLFFGGRPAEDVHLIYGVGAVLSLPFFIFVESTARKRPAMGSYIWGFALLAGIILRGIMTGG
ncbi:MAG: hypothetical protein K8L99_18930 [Anaerolineae bacterium]|nr:hypothetical protein [Anaerolineae bacterium]